MILPSNVRQQYLRNDRIALLQQAVTENLKNDFQECSRKLYEQWQKYVTAQGNYSEGYAVKINAKLLISV
jgi:hypothetical protein